MYLEIVLCDKPGNCLEIDTSMENSGSTSSDLSVEHDIHDVNNNISLSTVIHVSNSLEYSPSHPSAETGNTQCASNDTNCVTSEIIHFNPFSFSSWLFSWPWFTYLNSYYQCTM